MPRGRWAGFRERLPFPATAAAAAPSQFIFDKIEIARQPTAFRPGAAIQVGGRTLSVQSQSDDPQQRQHALAHAISV